MPGVWVRPGVDIVYGVVVGIPEGDGCIPVGGYVFPPPQPGT